MMTCPEFVELSGLYALGALSSEEMAAAVAHLEDAHHDGCLEALQRAALGAEVVARSLVPTRPSEQVLRNIEAQLGLAGAGQPQAPPRAARPRGRELLAWGLAAAAALLLFVQIAGRRSERARSDAQQAAQAQAASEQARQAAEASGKTAADLRRADEARAACTRELAALRGEHEAQQMALALLQSPSALVVSLKPPPGQPALSARALIDVAQQKGLLLSSALAAPGGRDYELWFIRGATKRPAGLLRGKAGGVVLASIDPQVLSEGFPDALAITLEPAGGMPQPSGPIVLLGALPKS